MSNKSRKYLIAGNWKMNLNAAEGVELAKELHQLNGQQTDVSVCVCPTLTGIDAVSKVLSDSNIALGAQNMHQASAGAYTGEFSAEMLRHLFCNYVIIGHSERREYFSETDSLVNQKTLAALAANLKPIVCVGESDEQRSRGEAERVIRRQVEQGLEGLDPSQLVVAYEPIWAIGTGKTCEASEANRICGLIRSWVGSPDLIIQYGGSVKPANIDQLMGMSDIDGVLVGGASLDPEGFGRIANYIKS